MTLSRVRAAGPAGARWWLPVVVLGVLALVVVLTRIKPDSSGLVVLAGAIGVLAAALGLAVPAVAAVFLLLAQFFRLPLTGILPVDPFLLAFAGLLVSTALAVRRSRRATVRVGAVELAMVLYLLWIVGSSLATHEYAAVEPTSGQQIPVWRFVLTSTLLPFVMFVVGRWVLVRVAAVRLLLWTLIGLTAYSAAMSIFQLYGPKSLVWPRYILTVKDWSDRAVGIFNQPVVNGLVMIIGFVAAIVVATQPGRPLGRFAAAGVGAAAVVGIYLTHTRAVWLVFALVLVAGVVFATGFRTPFVAALSTAALFVAVNWSTFISADRAEGGVASAGEVEDRLNTIATSFWAIEQQPAFGWGIARFASINTYHHQQWSPDTPWIRGYGIVSHFNELGIAAELGLGGLLLWLAVLLLVALTAVRAFRTLDTPGLHGRGLAFLSVTALGGLVITGFTVDLRYFDFPNSLVMLFVGIAAGVAERHTREPAAVETVAPVPQPVSVPA